MSTTSPIFSAEEKHAVASGSHACVSVCLHNSGAAGAFSGFPVLLVRCSIPLLRERPVIPS